MYDKNVAEMQNNREKGVEYSTQACMPALAPYWHNACVARLAGPKGTAEVTPGLAAIIGPGEYLCPCGQKKFVAGPVLDDLLEMSGLSGKDAAVDVWTTDAVSDYLIGSKVRREIRGQIRRLAVSAGGMKWHGEPRDVFFAITLSSRDVEKFGVEPDGEAIKESRSPSKGCEMARAMRKRQAERAINAKKPATWHNKDEGVSSLLELDGHIFASALVGAL